MSPKATHAFPATQQIRACPQNKNACTPQGNTRTNPRGRLKTSTKRNPSP
ncbi:hypothetical protein [Kingella potus]|nr:hypothetical protein [Kingella potus]UOO99877.1 hypothetical protein LVJ84_07270 [Kingella potus]